MIFYDDFHNALDALLFIWWLGLHSGRPPLWAVLCIFIKHHILSRFTLDSNSSGINIVANTLFLSTSAWDVVASPVTSSFCWSLGFSLPFIQNASGVSLVCLRAFLLDEFNQFKLNYMIAIFRLTSLICYGFYFFFNYLA